MESQSRHQDSDLIDALGGSGAVARLCEVTSQAVSQWRRAGIPRPHRKYLSLVRPDVMPAGVEGFDEPAKQAA